MFMGCVHIANESKKAQAKNPSSPTYHMSNHRPQQTSEHVSICVTRLPMVIFCVLWFKGDKEWKAPCIILSTL